MASSLQSSTVADSGLMARIGSPLPQEPLPPFLRRRRPALIPPNCSLSAAEAEELVRTRLHQPLFPPPDPRLFQTQKPAAPDQSSLYEPQCTSSDARTSPCSEYSSPGIEASEPFHPRNPTNPTKPAHIPPSIARDPQSRKAFLKARAQHARDQKLQQLLASDAPLPTTELSIPHANISPPTSAPITTAATSAKRPLRFRKHSAFVLDEELRGQQEARADTPHLSETLPGEDVDTGDVPSLMLEAQEITSVPGRA